MSEHPIPDRVARLLAGADLAGATALVESVRQSDPLSYELGQFSLAAARQDEVACMAHAQRAQSIAPTSPVAHDYLAVAHQMNGDRDAAVAAAQQAVALGGGAKSRASLGSLLLINDRAAEAVTVLRQALAEDARHADALLLLGTAYAKLGEYGDAISTWARAFDVRPEDTRPIRNLMDMFADVGRWMGAIAALDLSRRGTPPAEVELALDLVQVNLVRLVMERFPARKEVEDADGQTDKLLKSAARRPARVRLSVARVLLDLDRKEEAQALVASLAKEPLAAEDRAIVRYLEGVFAEARKDRDAAMDAYLDALELSNLRADACANAISLLLAEDGAEALRQIESLLAHVDEAHKASSPELLFNEAIYFTRVGREVEARRNFERVIIIGRGEGGAATMAVEALKRLGGG